MARKHNSSASRQPQPVTESAAPVVNSEPTPAPSAADTVVVALNRASGIVFPMPDGRRVTINGNAIHLRGKEKSILPVGGYGLTTIARADWEFIEKTYGPSMKIFESGLIFAADRKADAVDMADERAELRHGLEPVDPEKTQTKPNDGKD